MNSNGSIVVGGGGPAGSIAASMLARAGMSVTLVEQHRFPRDKVCGECLSATGIAVLRRVGAFDVVARSRPTALRRSLIHAPNGSMVEFRLPAPMWGISRRQLDHQLLQMARSVGVTILQPARVEKIDGCLVTIRDLTTNRISKTHAEQILIADGKSSSTSDLGVKAHFTDVHGPRDAIELFGVRGHYGGLAPVEGGVWNVSFSVPSSRVLLFRGDLDALFATIVSENRTLRERMHRARRASDWHASPLPRSAVASHWLAGQIPIGNAAASLEPIGGEGMGLAMRSAELAANEIIAAQRERRQVDTAALRCSYRELWRMRALACRAAAQIVSRPWLMNSLAGVIDGRDALPQMVLRLVGKHATI